ncbi:hypothetical protein M0R72_01065 [Candidatus Pacearchaeota archaeon]|jgi:hypothetical protein|nr:hypothetical protein [Candidatus Pacearchaeota archaeon]
MKLRQHRGGLAESMATTIEIEPTMEALLVAIRERYKGLMDVADDAVSVNPHGHHDKRNNWNTHIVVIQGFGVYGFTDGPLSC